MCDNFQETDQIWQIGSDMKLWISLGLLSGSVGCAPSDLSEQ